MLGDNVTVVSAISKFMPEPSMLTRKRQLKPIPVSRNNSNKTVKIDGLRSRGTINEVRNESSKNDSRSSPGLDKSKSHSTSIKKASGLNESDADFLNEEGLPVVDSQQMLEESDSEKS